MSHSPQLKIEFLDTPGREYLAFERATTAYWFHIISPTGEQKQILLNRKQVIKLRDAINNALEDEIMDMKEKYGIDNIIRKG